MKIHGVDCFNLGYVQSRPIFQAGIYTYRHGMWTLTSSPIEMHDFTLTMIEGIVQFRGPGLTRMVQWTLHLMARINFESFNNNYTILLRPPPNAIGFDDTMYPSPNSIPAPIITNNIPGATAESSSTVDASTQSNLPIPLLTNGDHEVGSSKTAPSVAGAPTIISANVTAELTPAPMDTALNGATPPCVGGSLPPADDLVERMNTTESQLVTDIFVGSRPVVGEKNQNAELETPAIQLEPNLNPGTVLTTHQTVKSRPVVGEKNQNVELETPAIQLEPNLNPGTVLTTHQTVKSRLVVGEKNQNAELETPAIQLEPNLNPGTVLTVHQTVKSRPLVGEKNQNAELETPAIQLEPNLNPGTVLKSRPVVGAKTVDKRSEPIKRSVPYTGPVLSAKKNKKMYKQEPETSGYQTVKPFKIHTGIITIDGSSDDGEPGKKMLGS